MAKEDKTNPVAAQAAAMAAGGGDDASPAAAPTSPTAAPAAVASVGAETPFVILESFTLNERTFGVGQKLTAKDVALFKDGMLDRRIKNGFIGLNA